MSSRRLALAAVAAALLVPPATSQGAVDTIGSDLSGTGTTAIQRTEDTALAQLTGSARPEVPHSGQVLSVEVKGCSAKDAPQDPETAIFVQDLRESGGVQEVITTSQRFHLPICGDPGAVTTFHPTDQCVTQGDLVGVVVGGQSAGYPQGTRYLITKPSPGTNLGAFSKNGETVIGSRFTLEPIADTELLMRARIGTGADSPSGCPGGSQPGGGGGGGGGGKVSPESLHIAASMTANPKTGRGGLSITCNLAAGDLCRVSLVATIGKTRVGTVAGAVPGAQTAALVLRLNRAGGKALRKSRRLRLTLTGTVRGAGGSAKLTHTLAVRAG